MKISKLVDKIDLELVDRFERSLRIEADRQAFRELLEWSNTRYCTTDELEEEEGAILSQWAWELGGV